MENKKYFFKIIIPNYNNYIYIKKCLDSILNQTFTDWHCIIVDDMSTDNSDKIAEIYSRRYPDKFTFLRMDYKGHEGGARNKGIDYPIDCEYYYFMDSDDEFYTHEALKILYVNVKNDYPDVLLFKMMEEKNGVQRIIPQPKFEWTSNVLAQYYNSASTKIVRYNKIQKFLECCDHAADSYQWMKVLDQSPTIKQIDGIIYHYIRRNSSITINGSYEKDKNKFFNEYLKLFYKNINNDVLRNMKIRIDNYSKTCTMTQHTKMITDLHNMCEKYNLLTLKQKNILIIGANESIKDFEYGDIIDSNKYFVIRLNREPQIEYYKNYGTKTDLFIGQPSSKNLLINVKNKIILDHQDILKISKYYNLPEHKHLTTGFIVLLMMLAISDNVSIFGFGYGNDKNDNETYKSIYETHLKTSHKLVIEHELIDSMINNEYKNILKRLEYK